MNLRRVVLALIGCVVLLALNAFAADPPGRVARLNYMSGQVSFQPGGVNDWVQATINRPLTTSDRIWTDRDSRAELQMGAASARLNGETSLTLANVSDNAVQLQLDQGTLNLHVVRLYDGEIYEIDTPNVAFTVQKSGDYRFDVDNAGDTTVVTVWKGRGEATGDNPGVRINSGQQFTFRGGRALQHVATNAPGYDGFDSWCKARADREDRSPSLRYVSPYSVGYSDLDEYGRWETVSPYGPVWIPAGLAPGWAPYRWGHWVFIAPWGWTWVDDAPWGFAPFHYGRWVYFGNYWGWCPGPVSYRPIYAPALVGWFGGSHWGFGLSFGVGGGVGWFPLGWGEPYLPYYGHSRGYFQNVNVSNTHITNITYITNNYYTGGNGGGHTVRPIQYTNQNVPNAVTAVSNATFTGARPTRGSIVPVSSQAIAGASVVSTVPVRPSRDSVIGPAPHATAPPVVATRPVVTKMTPPAGPVSTPSVEPGRPSRATGPVTPTTTVPTSATSDRPSRAVGPVTPATITTTPVATTNDRPSRAIPRPPQATAPSVTVATEEKPSGVPHPPQTISQPTNQMTSQPSAMPSRVPRPSPSNSMKTNGAPAVTTSPTVSAPVNEPSRVPRPTPTATPTPSTPDRSVTVDRSTREVPRPTTTPTAAPSPTVTERPVTHPPETHVATPTNPAPVQHTSPPPAAEHHSQPKPESRPPKTQEKKENAAPKASVRYPSPYNQAGYVRPASFTSRSVPRPTGPVAPAPRVYQASYSPARVYAPASSPAYSHAVPPYRQSISASAHVSHGTPTATHAAHASSAHSAGRSR